jgi:hypothetical protein
MPKKLTRKEFIADAKSIHGDKYDYSKFVYNGWDKEGCIICDLHGSFYKTPNYHLRGWGCKTCKTLIKAKQALTKFIIKARKIHGDKYSYLKFVYVATDNKSTITCSIHGDFEQTPTRHLSGRGCRSCGNLIAFAKQRSTLDEFIAKARFIHGDEYSYSNFIYNGNKVKGIISCKEHGDFRQTPDCHLSGRKCIKCAAIGRRIKLKYTFETFKTKADKIHNGIYNYDKATNLYMNCQTSIPIACLIHGNFEQKPTVHLRGHGCPICNIVGTNENLIFSILEENNIIFKHNYCIKKIDQLEARRFSLDFYFPDISTAIEYNGKQHYEPHSFSSQTTKEQADLDLTKQKNRDKYVDEFCKNHNIDIIWIDGRDYFGHLLRKHMVSLLVSLGLLTITQITQKYSWYK